MQFILSSFFLFLSLPPQRNHETAWRIYLSTYSSFDISFLFFHLSPLFRLLLIYSLRVCTWVLIMNQRNTNYISLFLSFSHINSNAWTFLRTRRSLLNREINYLNIPFYYFLHVKSILYTKLILLTMLTKDFFWLNVIIH